MVGWRGAALACWLLALCRLSGLGSAGTACAVCRRWDHGGVLSVSDCDGNVLESGLTLHWSENSDTVDVCLPLDFLDGYTITAFGSSYWDDISWSLMDPLGNIALEGGDGTYTTCPCEADTCP